MFTRSDSAITVGRIAGAPVRIGPGSVLVAAYIAYVLGRGWSDQASAATIFLVASLTGLSFLLSILAHEAGHAIVAKRAGIASLEIRLSLFGGVAALERGAPDAKTEMKVAAAGPAVNLVITAFTVGALFAVVNGVGTSIVTDALLWLAGINLILAVFNMLPGLPLDGGRVLTGFLWHRRGNRASAVRTTAKAGKALGYIAFTIAAIELIVFRSFFGIYTAFIGMILTRGADAELAQASMVEGLKGRTVNDVARFSPPVIDEDTNTASARALLPSPEASRWAIVRDADGIARGLLDLLVLDRAANVDGTDPVAGVMVPIDQRRAAYPAETLEDVVSRGVMAPFVVINEKWQPVALVETLGRLPMTPA